MNQKNKKKDYLWLYYQNLIRVFKCSKNKPKRYHELEIGGSQFTGLAFFLS